MAAPDDDATRQLSVSDLTQIAAAATAVVGVLTGLAVSGILGNAQRNHGDALIACFSLALLAAVFWIAAPLIDTTLRSPTGSGAADHQATADGQTKKGWLHRLNIWLVSHRVGVRAGLQLVGVLLFLAGVVLGIWALIETQRDAERPAVAATYDNATRLLAVTVSAQGLGSDQRLVIRVRRMKENESKEVPDNGKIPSDQAAQNQTNLLYVAVVGPDSDGEVTQKLSVYVPKGKPLVETKAWTGSGEPDCTTIQELEPNPAEGAGCVLIRIPGSTAATSST